MFWMQLLGIIGAIVVIWLLYRVTRSNPQAFSKENLNKSLKTMGFLALGLIAFITLCIFLIRSQ